MVVLGFRWDDFLGGSFARNIERKSWTRSAAAIPVISAKGTVKTPSRRRMMSSLLTVIVCRRNFDNIGTSLDYLQYIYRKRLGEVAHTQSSDLQDL